MKLWLIIGYTKEIGIWEVEIYKNKNQAEQMFDYYVKNYHAKIAEDNEWYAMCDDGIGRFYIEEREV